MEQQEKLKETKRRKIQKEVSKWDEKNEKALRVISFIVVDPLQGPIYYGITVKGGCYELRKVHASNDKPTKYYLIKCKESRQEAFTLLQNRQLQNRLTQIPNI